MKKLYFSLLSVAFVSGMIAQTTITDANHTPVSGETFQTKQCDPTSVSVGGNGNSVVWNFNSIVTLTNPAVSYLASSGPFMGWPSASVSVGSSTSDVAMYSGTATELKYWGGNLTLGGVAAQLQFTAPAVFMAYPTSLNSGTTSNISGSVAALGNSGLFGGTCSSTALATGTMALPSATFNSVIRVTTSFAITFTIQGIPGSANRILNEYYSLANSKYPVLAIDASTLSGLGTSTQTFVYLQNNYQTLGAKENGAEVSVKVNAYPNPAADILHIVSEGALAKNILVYDATGKQIESQTLINGSCNLNTSNYPNGLYIYKVTDAANRALKTGRVTVIH
jgi:hypothetical protein